MSHDVQALLLVVAAFLAPVACSPKSVDEPRVAPSASPPKETDAPTTKTVAPTTKTEAPTTKADASMTKADAPPGATPSASTPPVTSTQLRPLRDCSCACTGTAAPLALTPLVARLPAPERELLLPSLSAEPTDPARTSRSAEPRVDWAALARPLAADRVPTPSPDLSNLIGLCMDPPSDTAREPIHAASVRVYDVARVEPQGSEPLVAVLYSTFSPQDILLDRYMAEWRVALFSLSGTLMARQAFVTRIPFLAEWTSIYAALELESGKLAARITYGGSCFGGKYNQTFFASFDVGDDACLGLREVQRSGFR